MNNIETWLDDLLSVACSLCLCNSACFDIYKNIAWTKLPLFSICIPKIKHSWGALRALFPNTKQLPLKEKGGNESGKM